MDIHSLTGASRGAFFFLLRARRGKFTHSLARPQLCVVGTEGAFFFLLRARRGKFTPSLARLRLCVVEKAGAFFFLLRARRGEIHSLTGASGGAFFFLFCARRGKFTHSLARPRLCVVFFVVCAAGEIHSLTRASGGALCARRWTFTHSLARPGVIHSLTGACGGAFFFLLRARRGKFTHSLARPRLCVVGTEGAFFFCSVRSGGNSLPHWRVCGCVWLKKRARFFFGSVRGKGEFTHSLAHPGARFFFVLCAAGEIHSLTGASTAVCGFFLLFARRGKFTHSLARPGALFFLFAVCAAVDIHSLTGASGGDSLTHWRVRGRVFFFAPCAVGEIHSLTGASAAVCGWNRGRVFFFAPCAAGQAKKKHGARFFLVRHAAGRAKKKLFSRARRAKKNTSSPLISKVSRRSFTMLDLFKVELLGFRISELHCHLPALCLGESCVCDRLNIVLRSINTCIRGATCPRSDGPRHCLLVTEGLSKLAHQGKITARFSFPRPK